MVAVIDRKLVFGREQVLTSTQASKNFRQARRRARQEPQFVSDRNDGIDTVIVGYEEFEAMAVELEQLREERLHAIAAARTRSGGEADPSRKGIPFADVVGRDRIRCHGGRRRATDPVADAGCSVSAARFDVGSITKGRREGIPIIGRLGQGDGGQGHRTVGPASRRDRQAARRVTGRLQRAEIPRRRHTRGLPNSRRPRGGRANRRYRPQG